MTATVLDRPGVESGLPGAALKEPNAAASYAAPESVIEVAPLTPVTFIPDPISTPTL